MEKHPSILPPCPLVLLPYLPPVFLSYPLTYCASVSLCISSYVQLLIHLLSSVAEPILANKKNERDILVIENDLVVSTQFIRIFFFTVFPFFKYVMELNV